MSKVALIVETREHPALPMVLKSVRRALDNDWKLQIYHGNKNIDYMKKISDTEWGQNFIMTPMGFDELPQWPESNDLMVSKEFWNTCRTNLRMVLTGFQKPKLPKNVKNANS